jgi:hypothetical protein
MKTLYALLMLCLLLFCCGKETKAPEPVATPQTQTTEKKLRPELDTFYLGNRLVRVEKASKHDFDRYPETPVDTSEAANLARDSQWVKRIGDTLAIKTDAREVLIVSNDNEEAEEDFAHYDYSGYMPKTGQFILCGYYYESYDYLMVDKKTGDITHAWGRPEVSPDGKMFITANSDMMAGFTYNGLQLYNNTHKPVLVGQRELQHWGPAVVKWADNKTLLVKADVVVDNEDTQTYERTEYFRLVLE